MIALLVALGSGKFDVVGVTTIFGNVFVNQATKNALILLELMGHPEIPVYQGSQDRWAGTEIVPPTFVHGNNGLGDVDLPIAKRTVENKTAAEFIVDICNQYPGEIEFLFDGPLTNLADAIKLDPTIPSKWKRVAIMGGAFFVNGNINQYAEANIFNDPEAADYVFKYGKNLIITGLDITHECPFTENDIYDLIDINALGQLLADIYLPYIAFYNREKPEIGGAPPHDAVALLALTHPDLFLFTSGPVRVKTKGPQRGRTIVDDDDSSRASQEISVDGFFGEIVYQMKLDIMTPFLEKVEA